MSLLCKFLLTGVRSLRLGEGFQRKNHEIEVWNIDPVDTTEEEVVVKALVTSKGSAVP
jgi:hypothetical protein